MKTISKLAKQFGISRTTLLYYDSEGLLKASKRTPSGYRLYGEKEEERLRLISAYRKTGLALKEIKKLLRGKTHSSFVKILEKRLSGINTEIQELKNQQFIVLKLLQNKRSQKMGKTSKDEWVKMFREAGLTDKQMEDWHRIFEKNSPEGHQEFLEFLNISKEEINMIREKFAN